MMKEVIFFFVSLQHFRIIDDREHFKSFNGYLMGDAREFVYIQDEVCP